MIQLGTLGEKPRILSSPFGILLNGIGVEQDVDPTWEEEDFPSIPNMDISAVSNDLGMDS